MLEDLGEVAAILGNSDPACIEYKNTVDTLNAFAAERKFPAEMQRKLREFFVSGLREFMAGRSVSIPVSQLAKWKTTLQLVAIGVLIAAPVFPDLKFVNTAGLVVLWASALITAQTGIAYFRGTLDHV